MNQDSLMTEEIRGMIGKSVGEPVTCAVETSAIRRFIGAVEDFNPLWVDDSRARRAGYGKAIAPPIFINSIRPHGYMEALSDIKGFTRSLALGTEYEFFGSVSSGDEITVEARFVDIREKETQRGKMLFITIEKTYKNQDGKIVVIERSSVGKY